MVILSDVSSVRSINAGILTREKARHIAKSPNDRKQPRAENLISRPFLEHRNAQIHSLETEAWVSNRKMESYLDEPTSHNKTFSDKVPLHNI
jgi:hypothetical protein